jgi:hypothetical protein
VRFLQGIARYGSVWNLMAMNLAKIQRKVTIIACMYIFLSPLKCIKEKPYINRSLAKKEEKPYMFPIC